jgi:hypothetical protein
VQFGGDLVLGGDAAKHTGKWGCVP